MAEGYPQAGPPACGDIQKNPKTFGFGFLAPQVGLEPTTTRLTAGCSAIELLRITCCIEYYSYMEAKMQ